MSFGLTQTADDLGIRVLGMLGYHGTQAFQYLADRLVKLDLPGVAFDDLVEHRQKHLVQRGHATVLSQLPQAAMRSSAPGALRPER